MTFIAFIPFLTFTYFMKILNKVLYNQKSPYSCNKKRSNIYFYKYQNKPSKEY